MNEKFEKARANVREWWDKHGDKVELGMRIGAVCFAVGFFKGLVTMSKINEQAIGGLLKRIPITNDDEQVEDYILGHLDELKPKFDEIYECVNLNNL